MKKVTMKDIAREANVSVATVSYILNKVNNQIISDETRCRVLDAAKRLNYVPSLAARSLAMGKSGLLGLILGRNLHDGYWRRLYYGILAERLELLCRQAGYHLLVSGVEAANPNMDIMLERELDGVFLVDVKEEVFRSISVHFSIGVPIVLLDSYIDDPLFHKVLFHYDEVFASLRERTGTSSQDWFLITESFNNAGMTQAIVEASQADPSAIFVMAAGREHELGDFLEKQRGKTGVATNEFIGSIAARSAVGLGIRLFVLCTADCPEIVPPSVKTLRVDKNNDNVRIAVNLMLHHLEVKGEKYGNISSEGNQRKYHFSRLL